MVGVVGKSTRKIYRVFDVACRLLGYIVFESRVSVSYPRSTKKSGFAGRFGTGRGSGRNASWGETPIKVDIVDEISLGSALLDLLRHSRLMR